MNRVFAADGRPPGKGPDGGARGLRIKDMIRKYWDSRAAECAGACRMERSPMWKRHGRELLLACLGEDRLDVLDVGTGTGVVAGLLAEMGHRVTGIDLSLEMLDAALRDAEEAGREIDYRLGDAERTEFADGSFDAVVGRDLVWTLPHPFEAMKEWRRLLRPGGVLLILDGDRSPPPAVEDAGSLGGYTREGIETCLPMRKVARPAADVEMLGRLGFRATFRMLDSSDHADGAPRPGGRFLVRGELPG